MANANKPERKPGIVRRAAGASGRRFMKWTVGDTREVVSIYQAMKERLHRLMRPGDYANTETFEEACERFGLTDADVERRATELQSSARLYLGIALVALLVFGFLPWSSHPVSHGLSSFLVMAMAVSKYSVTRWRQAQCEQRDLMTYANFWRQWWGQGHG